MTTLDDRIRHAFGNSIEAKIAAADILTETIAKAVERLTQCLLHDRKILICGHGASISNAMYFTSLLLHHQDVARPGLPAVLLGGDLTYVNTMLYDPDHQDIFARHIQALGQAGDVLLMITTLEHTEPLLHAIAAAHDRGIDIVALTGRDGSVVAKHFGPEDIEIRVPHDIPIRIREIHFFILHTFNELIEQLLFGHT